MLLPLPNVKCRIEQWNVNFSFAATNRKQNGAQKKLQCKKKNGQSKMLPIKWNVIKRNEQDSGETSNQATIFMFHSAIFRTKIHINDFTYRHLNIPLILPNRCQMKQFRFAFCTYSLKMPMKIRFMRYKTLTDLKSNTTLIFRYAFLKHFIASSTLYPIQVEFIESL